MKKISKLFQDKQHNIEKSVSYSHRIENPQDFIESLPDYLFSRTSDLNQSDTGFSKALEAMISNATAFNILLSIIRSNSLANETSSSMIQFYLGPILSGAPFHSHGSALNALVYGRKRWSLLPPSKDVYMRLHPALFELHVYEGKLNDSKLDEYLTNSCHIDQYEGEILFIPRHWSHQVLNLAASVGFAVEIRDYY